MERSLSERVIQCAFEVSNQLGAGFLEAVYENALCIEMKRQGIEFQRQKSIEVIYKDQVIGNYIADIVVENKLLIELKALSDFSKQHEAQLMNYLKATGIKVGLLLNFGTPRVSVRRIAWRYDEAEKI